MNKNTQPQEDKKKTKAKDSDYCGTISFLALTELISSLPIACSKKSTLISKLKGRNKIKTIQINSIRKLLIERANSKQKTGKLLKWRYTSPSCILISKSLTLSSTC